MKVHIDKIGREGYDLDEPLSESWVETTVGPDAPFRPSGEGRLAVHLSRVGEEIVHVKGNLRLTVRAQCGRCLDAVPVVIESALHVALFPAGSEPKPAIDGEVEVDDMGVSTYENREIDLATVVRDEVLLEFPMIPLCSDDCAGLCTACGANLNQGPCTCQRPFDPRWQGLQRVKLN